MSRRQIADTIVPNTKNMANGLSTGKGGLLPCRGFGLTVPRLPILRIVDNCRTPRGQGPLSPFAILR